METEAEVDDNWEYLHDHKMDEAQYYQLAQ